jgi:phage antirepressor YoqD-like protein
MFLMNRDGFSLLAMGFTGKQALKFKMDFVGAFNKMEEALKRTTMTALPDFTNPAEAARAWAEQFELKQIEAKRADEAEQQVLALTSEIEQMQPKVSYYDNILANKSTVLITQIAQDYGMSAKALNRTLNELGVQHKVNDQWILYAKFLGQGYVQSKPVTITHNNGRQSVKYNTEWTQKGRLFLYDELKKHNILPLIEMSQQF